MRIYTNCQPSSMSPLTPCRLSYLVLLFSMLVALPTVGQGRVSLMPGDTLLFESERQALQERLSRSVFRVVADVLPPEPYQQLPMRYDGAAVAIDHEGDVFITTAAWLTSANQIFLLDGGDELLLEVVLLDVRYDLALLRLAPEVEDEVEDRVFQPLSITNVTSVSSYTLLSPQTPYELLAPAVVLAQENEEGGLYWTTTLAAANGYPLITAGGRVVALQARRSSSQPKERGIAVGWPAIADFLHPPEGLAHAREPDHVMQTPTSQGRRAPQSATDKGARTRW